MQYKKLGQFIRNKRILLGFTLNKFAIHCEIEPASLSNFERGLSGINLDTLISIAKGFDKTLGELIIEYEQYLKTKNI